MSRRVRARLICGSRESSRGAKTGWRACHGRAQAGFARRSEQGCGEARAAASRLPARCRTRGAAAVEFALVLPLLMMLVLGSIDYGYYFFLDHVMTNAAREGARAGTLWQVNANATADATQTARDYITRAGLDPNASGASVTVTFQTLGAPAANSVRVVVAYPAGSLTGFTPLVPSYANATSEMRRQ